MYTKDNYRTEIEKLILEKGYHPAIVAKKTLQIFVRNRRYLDDNLYEKLIDIFTMEEGPEFEMTKEEFRKFIDNM